MKSLGVHSRTSTSPNAPRKTVEPGPLAAGGDLQYVRGHSATASGLLLLPLLIGMTLGVRTG
ncbi:hypothetical protein [Streptomyces avermitilis]|uniref:hypothetical protein n=1 Tax=Streptomyces avermitilis TaxID=33903 RepID=UPI0033A51968